MLEPAVAPADNPTTEALATTGLFLLLTAVIAVAVSVASWGAADTPLATASGLIASVSFATSLVCFAVQSRDK